MYEPRLVQGCGSALSGISSKCRNEEFFFSCLFLYKTAIIPFLLVVLFLELHCRVPMSPMVLTLNLLVVRFSPVCESTLVALAPGGSTWETIAGLLELRAGTQCESCSSVAPADLLLN